MEGGCCNGEIHGCLGWKRVHIVLPEQARRSFCTSFLTLPRTGGRYQLPTCADVVDCHSATDSLTLPQFFRCPSSKPSPTNPTPHAAIMATNNEYNRQQLLAADANEDPSPEEIYAMIQASAEHRARTDSQFQAHGLAIQEHENRIQEHENRITILGFFVGILRDALVNLLTLAIVGVVVFIILGRVLAQE